MTEKLSYEEWRTRYFGKVTIAEGVREDLMKFHNVDADREIENAMRKEYESYLNGEYDK
jgi:hypothetical protein